MNRRALDCESSIVRTRNVKLLLGVALLIRSCSWAPSATTVHAFSAAPTPTPVTPGRRKRASPPTRPASSASGPKGSRRTPRRSPRTERRTAGARRRERPPPAAEETFDPKAITRSQPINGDAPALSLFDESAPPPLRLRSSAAGQIEAQASGGPKEAAAELPPRRGKAVAAGAHFEQLSLDSLFPHLPGLGFSHAFFHDGEFREAIRAAVRQDVFYSTPAYDGLSPKVAEMMLNDDSSLQGSWSCPPRDAQCDSPPRMDRLTLVLRNKLGDHAPTGDDFFMALGALCGFNPSTHFIDIIGIKDRRIAHAWHQDTGRSITDLPIDHAADPHCMPQHQQTSSCYTVMLGFPCENEYDCAGVFSHVVKLAEEHIAPEGHNLNEPLLFEGVVHDNFIVRPTFGLGREILRYRDVDCLHSAPDVQYRSSIMRFM